MNEAYVLGGAQTDFARNWSREGKGVLALLREISEDTLAATGLSKAEMEALNKEGRIACFVGSFASELYVGQGHLGALLSEVDPVYTGIPSARYEAACASSSVALDAAISHIHAGDYDVCIVYGFELMKSVDAKTCGDVLGYAAWRETEAQGIEFPFPKLFGRLANELLDKYGYDEDRFMRALASISVKNYSNARRNPLAQTRNWYSSEREANDRGSKTNPRIGGLLANTDCSQVTDGAAGVVLVSQKYMQEQGIKRAARVAGWGHRVARMQLKHKLQDAAESNYVLPWTKRAVDDAYARAGIDASQVDVFETHDCFTSSEFAAISSLGLARPGDEIALIEDGAFAFDGAKPINPSGGLIGCGHPVGASGARMFLDITKQVMGMAGDYQIEGAHTAAMLNIGGSATTNYVFVVTSND